MADRGHGSEDTGEKLEKRQRAERKNQLWLTRGATAAAACAAIGIGGFYLGRRQPDPRPAQIATSVSTSAAIVEDAHKPDDNVDTLERDKNDLQGQLVNLKAKLAEAKTDQESLRRELAAANEKLTSFERSQAASKEGLKEVQESKSQVALLESEAERLRQRLGDSEAKLSAQQRVTDQVSEKLKITEANLQQELSLRDAKNQMGELVAARNLHIVDVYDADPSGNRQRAFGRVFYEEGKSLMFYAYDLDDPTRHRANVVFHVWGGNAGVKEVTHSLGILQKDEGGESRWAMTFDDPKVLAQINSVFVTAESVSKHYDEPHGKKVLYAYFGGAPNHP
jgi:hypothetical protein